MIRSEGRLKALETEVQSAGRILVHWHEEMELLSCMEALLLEEEKGEEENWEVKELAKAAGLKSPRPAFRVWVGVPEETLPPAWTPLPVWPLKTATPPSVSSNGEFKSIATVHISLGGEVTELARWLRWFFMISMVFTDTALEWRKYFFFMEKISNILEYGMESLACHLSFLSTSI